MKPKLTTPEDSRDLSPCPFCHYGRCQLTITTVYITIGNPSVHIHGVVECPYCGGSSGKVLRKLSPEVEDFSPVKEEVKRELERLWSGAVG
jgi:hypothetical protein